MRKFYYYSNRKLSYSEIGKFWLKFTGSALLVSAIFSLLIWEITNITYLNGNKSLSEYKSDSLAYEASINEVLKNYEILNNRLDNLLTSGNDMRLKLNKPVSSFKYDSLGTGGNVIDEKSLYSNVNFGKIFNIKDKISSKINMENESLNELSTQIKYFEKISDYLPAIKPVIGGYYGDRFGSRMHPLLHIKRMHTGLDIVVNIGTKVYAPGNGKVSFVGRRGGYGNTVEIDHGFGLKTLYAHLSKFAVKKGDLISRGDLVAYSGNSGTLSAGAHLHYEVRKNGVPVEPLDYISDEITVNDFINLKNN